MAAVATCGGQRRAAPPGGGRRRLLAGGRLEAAATAVVLVPQAGPGVRVGLEVRRRGLHRGPCGSTWAARSASRHAHDTWMPYTCMAGVAVDIGGWVLEAEAEAAAACDGKQGVHHPGGVQHA